MKIPQWSTKAIASALVVVTFVAASAQTLPYTRTPELTAVVGSALPERIASGFGFTEAPFWHAAGYLSFSDLSTDTVYSFTPPNTLAVLKRPGGGIGGRTADRQGRLISLGARQVTRLDADGVERILADRFEGKRLNNPNDAVVGSAGIYFTDPPYGLQPKDEELGFYGVYLITNSGELRLLMRDMVRPNGIALSPDGQTLYVNDSDISTHLTRAFSVQADGSLTNSRVFAVQPLPTQAQGNALSIGSADGMKVDQRGNIYSTGPGGLYVYSPVGKALGRIDFPEVIENLVFGDADRKTLYVVGTTSIYKLRVMIAGSRDGGG